MLISCLLICGLCFATGDTDLVYPGSPSRGPQDLAVFKISVTADDSGVIDYISSPIYGKLYSIGWQNNSYVNGTIYVNATNPYLYSIKSYNLSGGNATEYPRDLTMMHFLDGPLRVNCNNGTAGQTLNVWLFMER
jgi:fructose-1,6-bisphosphatase/inositol monophosphatase family enzyme